MEKYANKNFPLWNNTANARTFVTPAVFSFGKEDRYVPETGSILYISEFYDKKGCYSKSAEEIVGNAFIRFGDYTDQPMFIFRNFEIKKMIKTLNKYDIIEQTIKENHSYETDLIIVHREFGIILVEVKSNIHHKYEEAQDQLDKRETKFQLVSKTFLSWIKKVIACPYQYERDIRSNNRSALYIHLCKDHINSFENFQQWWNSAIAPEQTNGSFQSTYLDVVPKLLGPSSSMKINLDMRQKVQGDLHFQRSLQKVFKDTQKTKTEAIKELRNAKLEIQKAERHLIKWVASKVQKATLHIQKCKEHIKK